MLDTSKQASPGDSSDVLGTHGNGHLLPLPDCEAVGQIIGRGSRGFSGCVWRLLLWLPKGWLTTSPEIVRHYLQDGKGQ